jgi:xanthine dehydrogenase YagR molybdenum-binding subunit
MDSVQHIGAPRDRVDGAAKVTGRAKYTGEFTAPGLLYGVVVSSTIARGRIKSIESAAALAVPGVHQVFTHATRPQADWYTHSFDDEVAPPGEPFRPLYDDHILFSGQPVALVVADEFGIARHAASLVQVAYVAEEPDAELDRVPHYDPPVKRSGIPGPLPPQGDLDRAFATAAARVHCVFRQPFEQHNPMELHGVTVIWEDDGKLTVYDRTQGVQNNQHQLCSIFGRKPEDLRVLSPYVGGAFGLFLRPRYTSFLAVMAALALQRSVRVVLNRAQMWGLGSRPEAVQELDLAADEQGRLQAITHATTAATSQYEDYQEPVVNWSATLYPAAARRYQYLLGKLHVATPCDMRAPGAATGLYALESAMDELAVEARLDPLELRLRNYTDRDPSEDKPFTSKELREAYRLGAERFGWSRRNPQPRSMRDGHELVGWGMATGIWDALYVPHEARAVLDVDGKLTVRCATVDLGTGTYTILTQIAADALGLAMDDVEVRLGDSSLPKAPVSGGSWTAASAGTAVHAACTSLCNKLFEYARRLNESPLGDTRRDEVVFTDGMLRHRDDAARGLELRDVLRGHGLDQIEADGAARPDKAVAKTYSACTHSAIFAEVKIDAELGVVRVTRLVLAVAAGRILNPKTARSQLLGGAVFGIGMALHEESMLDPRFGRFINANLAEYHVPSHADIHDIEIVFVPEQDRHLNPLGVKGVGEIGVVGTAAAIANAVRHATGVRIGDLPITIDKVLAAL